MRGLGRCGVYLPELLPQRINTAGALAFGHQRLAQVGSAGDLLVFYPAAAGGLYVQPRAAAKDGQAAAGKQPLYRAVGIGRVIGRAVGRARGKKIKEVVRHGGLLLLCGLGGANIHAAVDLHRIAA